MACDTCSHTMQCLFDSGEKVVYWCPRCGTLKTLLPNYIIVPASVEAPRLVERCREFESEIRDFHDTTAIQLHDRTVSQWRRLGLSESINLPENRPQ